jgi:hypothetical protein
VEDVVNVEAIVAEVKLPEVKTESVATGVVVGKVKMEEKLANVKMESDAEGEKLAKVKIVEVEHEINLIDHLIEMVNAKAKEAEVVVGRLAAEVDVNDETVKFEVKEETSNDESDEDWHDEAEEEGFWNFERDDDDMPIITMAQSAIRQPMVPEIESTEIMSITSEYVVDFTEIMTIESDMEDTGVVEPAPPLDPATPPAKVRENRTPRMAQAVTPRRIRGTVVSLHDFFWNDGCMHCKSKAARVGY